MVKWIASSVTLSVLNIEDKWKFPSPLPHPPCLSPHTHPGQAPSCKGWTAQPAYPRPQQSLEVCSQLPGQGIQVLKAQGQRVQVGMCSQPLRLLFL